ILELPLSLWRTFRLEQRFGFNRTNLAMFFKDLSLEILLILVLGIPLILTILWLMQQAGGLWWLYAWGVWTCFTLFLIWAYPTLISPLFNKFKPLEAGELRTCIESLLARCGFNAAGVFIMDNSKRSAHGNAYFTGLGRTKRIVLFDTLVEQLTIAELEAVLAHELGHYKHHHVQIRLLMSLIITFIGFALLGWLTGQNWFYKSFGVLQVSNGTALSLFALIAPVFSQFLSPLSSWLLRQHEYQADTFAIKQTSGLALINALVKLYKDNASTLTPDPLFSAFHDTHPPAPLRIKNIEHQSLQTI
ncbi:peptidase M48, partial [Achromatium sp. WMS1]